MKNISIKNRIGTSVLLLVCAMSFTECKKGGGSAPDPTPDNTQTTGPSVYVAGFEYDASGNISTAEYWKDGVAVKLSDGKNPAIAYSLTIAGTDIYVAGVSLVNGKAVATYWKNGTAVTLPDNVNTVGTSIAVNGSDVYVCGYEQNANGYSVPKYWKNGILNSLPTGDPSGFGQAINMMIVNSDVYIAGYATGANTSYSLYWKNGVPVKLGNGPADSEGASIFVDQLSHVYVAGNVGLAGPGIDHGDYWVDGTLSSLTDGTNTCSASSVKVSSAFIVVGGNTTNNSRQYAAYWKNGTITKISDASADATLIGVDIYGNDVYSAGFVTKSNGGNTPVYWKNSTVVNLTGVANSSGGQAFCVVVK